MGTLALALATSAVAGAALLFAACLRMRSALGFLLAAYLLASAEVIGAYLYPAWDARLRRTVLFVGESGDVPETAEWLVVGPGKTIDAARLARNPWQLALSSAGGWRVFRR